MVHTSHQNVSYTSCRTNHFLAVIYLSLFFLALAICVAIVVFAQRLAKMGIPKVNYVTQSHDLVSSCGL